MTTDLPAGSLTGAVIAFDLDGTLVDSAPDILGALDVLMAEEGLAPLPFAESRAFVGRGARWLVERGFQAAGQPLDGPRSNDLLARFLVQYRGHLTDRTRPFPGVEAALDALIAAGATLAVCTNKNTEFAVKIMEGLGLADRFAAIVGADMAPAAKPDPRHLQAAVEAAGGTLQRCILVGDAGTDAGAARAANAGLILVTFGYTETPVEELGGDILIDHYDELPVACARLLLNACEPQA